MTCYTIQQCVRYTPERSLAFAVTTTLSYAQAILNHHCLNTPQAHAYVGVTRSTQNEAEARLD